jgi:peptide/nickel transport system substrate-binding protein
MPARAAALPGRRFYHHVLAAGLTAVLVALLAGCAVNLPSAAPGRLNGGTATVALQPGDQFSWILPLLPFSASTGANLEYSEYLMWRPLYWFGSPRHVGLNQAESLANPAVITARGGQTTATIQLKPYRWSNGTLVTSRDVQFWFNLLKAEKANWWDYVPEEFPDNVSAFTILSPSRFSLTFKGSYSAAWLYNELGQLIPLPQQSWDKTSARGKDGNYDQTPAGSRSVYDFLAAQNKDLATYATNPLWQMVDGPWRLTGYASATGDATYTRNPRYSGPATGSVRELRVISFTSDTAEFDTLLSAGGISYGYIPFDDAAQTTRVTADGYTIAAWPTWGITYITLNYAAPQTGPIFRQLYVRQAMQHLINQAADISDFLQGNGNPTYGPVPLVPGSAFISPQQSQNPYPYNPAVAVSLLRSHGWQITPHGTDTCQHPGTAPGECGSGIAAGARLSFSVLYATSTQGVDEEVATLQSAFAQVGIRLSLSGAPFDTVVGDDVPCAHTGCWQMNYYGQGWYFDPAYNEPDGSAIFDSAGGSNSGGYHDPAADALMAKLPSGGYQALYAYENYLAQQLPVLWMPQFDFQISAVASTLRGVYPQDPLTNIYPENWYFVK